MKAYALATIAICIAATRDAAAHHAEMQSGIAFAEPRTLVGLGVEGTTFNLPVARGTFLTTTVFGAWAPLPALAIGARAPFHALSLGDRRDAGVGDVELTARVRIVATEHVVVSLAASLEVPTGNDEKGLGAGHFGLAPALVASYSTAYWTVFGSIGDALHLAHDEHKHEAEHAHDHVMYVNPHSDHELAYRLGVLIEPRRSFLLGAQLVGATVLAKEDRGATFVAGGPQIALRLARNSQLVFSWLVGVTGERRFDERASVTMQTMF